MDLMVNPVITDFQQDVNGDIKMLKLGANKQDAYANIIGQASADLDNNKTKTIDVSTYTEPVEILPTSGKDGMKKATVTLSNIPSPSGSATAYCWKYTYNNTDFYEWFNFSVAPAEHTDNDKMLSINAVDIEGDIYPTRIQVATMGNVFGPVTYVKISDTSFSLQFTESDPPNVYTRYSDRDFTLWEI